MYYNWTKWLQWLTGQVCRCNHTKAQHIKEGDTFDQMKKWDQHCTGMIFEGKVGGGATLHCCQCIHYHKKRITDNEFIRVAILPYIRQLEVWLKHETVLPLDVECFCDCSHSFLKHTGPLFDSIYRGCGVTACECKVYKYEGPVKHRKRIEDGQNNKKCL